MTEAGMDCEDTKKHFRVLVRPGPSQSLLVKAQGAGMFQVCSRPWKLERVCHIQDCGKGHSRLKKVTEQRYQTEQRGVPENTGNFGQWTHLSGTQSSSR